METLLKRKCENLSTPGEDKESVRRKRAMVLDSFLLKSEEKEEDTKTRKMTDGEILLNTIKDISPPQCNATDVSSYLRKTSQNLYARWMASHTQHHQHPRYNSGKPAMMYQPIYILPPPPPFVVNRQRPHAIHHTPPPPPPHNAPAAIAEFVNKPEEQQKTTKTNNQNKAGFRCPICDKVYCRKYVLKIHMRTHSGEKPLQCGVCGKCFSDPSNMKKHMRLHGGDTGYRCNTCDRSFNRRRDLQRHMTNFHKDMGEAVDYQDGSDVAAATEDAPTANFHHRKVDGMTESDSSSHDEEYLEGSETPVVTVVQRDG